jgi:hypothetical protein
MELPKEPVTFAPEQLVKLIRTFSECRHNVNNHLTMIIGAAELVRRKPEMAERMSVSLTEQARKIEGEMKNLSGEFERALLTRP